MRFIIALILAVLACAPARANDSRAELATGGLVFVRNPDVEMRAEDLFISADEIRVRYHFFNNATQSEVSVPWRDKYQIAGVVNGQALFSGSAACAVR